MRVLIIVLICAAVAFSQNTDARAKEKIAVYVTGNVRVNEKKALGTKILVELINSGRYRAVERSDDFVKELDREQSKQMSGAVDDNQITTIGKQFGVQVICVADLTPAFGSYQISARLIDVESAEIIAIAEVSNTLESMDDLTAASKDVVRVVLGLGKSKKQRFRTATNAKAQSLSRNSIGVRAAFGTAMNFDGQFTTITSGGNGRIDLMMGYCGGFKYETAETVAGNYPYYANSVAYKKEKFSAFELVTAIGWPIGITGNSPISGYVSPAIAMYAGSDIFDLGLGGQIGVECIWDDFVFGIDFRPLYLLIVGDSFRYTIGLSARYRI
jgi:hypothetical protein